jgi:hypothetical protein
VVIESSAVYLYLKDLERLLTFEVFIKLFPLLLSKSKPIGQRVEATISGYLKLIIASKLYV